MSDKIFKKKYFTDFVYRFVRFGGRKCPKSVLKMSQKCPKNVQRLTINKLSPLKINTLILKTMISKICSILKLCPVNSIESLTKDSITLKEGQSMITVIQKKPVPFSIKSYETAAGYRKDFSMQSILPYPEANSFYRFKKSLILQLLTSAGETIIVGSPEFPVKAEFTGDNNLVTVDFKQSEPG